MRPKKNVLLFVEDESNASIDKFTLQNAMSLSHTFHLVRHTAVVRKLIEHHTPAFFDCIVIIRYRNEEIDDVIDAAKESNVQLILWNRGKHSDHFFYERIGAYLPMKSNMEELRERVRLFTARKRGPRKGFRSSRLPKLETVCA